MATTTPNFGLRKPAPADEVNVETDINASMDTIDTALAARATTAALSAHEADTTNIHGIANTALLETTAGSQAKVDTHIADGTAAHVASAVGFTPTGGIAATDVQAAIAEVDSEKAASGHNHAGVYEAAGHNHAGTYEPAGTVATHEADTTSVHGIANTANLMSVGILDAKGDLIVASAADTAARLAVGTNGHVLTADSAEATGVKWAAASGGGGATITQQASAPASPAANDLWIDTDEVAQSGIGASPVVLAETTLGSDAANIEFASISGSYRHLRVEGQLRSTEGAVTAGYLCVRVGNGSVDTGATNYRAFAFNLATSDYTSTGRAEFIPGKIPAATADADVFGHFEMTIHDYTTTTYWRLMTARCVYMATTGAVGGFWDGQSQWKNKANAINVVRVYPLSGNLLAGSQLRLIGIPAP